MKLIFSLFFFLFISISSYAEHITGGEMFYTFRGITPSGEYQYRVTLKLYRDCSSPGAQLDGTAAIAIFDKSRSNLMIWSSSVPRTRIDTLRLGSPGACITNAPTVCYQVGYYEFDVNLGSSTEGYTITYQRCCRINGINNLSNSGGQGATYTADIPGTGSLASGPQNNSARFTGRDTVIVCAGYPFTYSFAAADADTSDRLQYSFCTAYIGGGQGGGQGGPNTPAPNPPAAPPYSPVSYSFPYQGTSPLGVNVTIDPLTGMITGRAPVEGIYVVTVCVSEIRNGVTIATQRKDLQIKAGGCDIAKAQLNPEYITCDGFTMNFRNLSNSPLINSYYWEFGDPSSGPDNTSTSNTPTHTYSVAGDYTIKLVTNRNQECSDSTTAVVKVWPGFFPDFNSSGVCVVNPVQFNDRTRTNYGVVDSWLWDFGDASTTTDASDTRNPQWTYADTGSKNVRLIVTNSKGCRDTVFKTVKMTATPQINMAFRDTLICVPDQVRLQASGGGLFTWSPQTNMINGNTATPTVDPTTTTKYTVELDQDGCVSTDTVLVRVVRVVTARAMNDTTICLTDPVVLRLESDGLQHQWTPSSTLNDPNLKEPTATPTGNTTYSVLARIGSCTATENIIISTAPYPMAYAGNDTTICYNTPAFLTGSHNGSSFSWTPTNSLVNANTLNPTANPTQTTHYVLSATANFGCPKPGTDTVVVTVLPKIRAYAGNDTMVIVGQPLQLNAEGGSRYQWIPATWLNNSAISNPIGLYRDEVDSIRYTVHVYNEAGCNDSAFVSVRVFKTNPYVFVPSAFTPNGDGLNDVIRPIAVGVREIRYFRIYNRWGQMIFSTTQNQKGWDGRISGTLQGTNVFVWMVSAIDYTGRNIFLKGTFTLIR